MPVSSLTVGLNLSCLQLLPEYDLHFYLVLNKAELNIWPLLKLSKDMMHISACAL